ncbi:MAG TPA: acetyl-CoA decarbonylase/synthase complex subunit alpha/beta, partial [Spirochaetota bacterium]|nr:acetyl-CoA decarbonylase/synthase complex subunit alpha/beta [Spirochaetota bacterium]
MSKIICSSAIDGAALWVSRAEAKLDEAISLKGETAPVGFPDTAYYLPVIYSFTGEKMETLSDLRRALRRAKELLPERPSDNVWLPYLGGTLDAGVASLFACEIIESCRYLAGPAPVDGIWLGAASDVIMRERGIEFVDGTAPGFAAITGAAPSNETAVKIARELQEKNLYVFMAGRTNGRQFAEQLAEEGVQLGWETRLVPFGQDVSALIYALGFANRAALSFGGVRPGDFEANLRYNKNRIFAFVLALGEVDAEKYAAAAGALNYGFPVIADTAIPEILPSGITTYEHVVANMPHESMVERALEVRGCKIKVTRVPIPVSYGAAFEGERIRKQDTHAEFGGNITTAFEYVTSVEMDDISDGEIEIIGKDINDIEPGSALPLGIWVEVAGRKMQQDFESILERQIHHLINGAEGIWHMGQRDIVWTRVSKNAFERGVRLRHYGEIIHAKFLANYPAIVDKVRVTLITDAEEVERRVAAARAVYQERNRRLESMTDESVDTFYSCLLCQSFAPNHVCVITPERLGLCGAYNWLDGKAAYEIDETGPNQPVPKGECLDPVKGIWQGVNDYVYPQSHKTVEAFCAYSIMDRPMTSCGCFEVILAYLPETNGVMAVNREYTGETPVGMSFSTLAGTVGGGMQTPGFMGCGKVFLTSRKFLYAEGGHRRITWMTKELKEILSEDLSKRFEEQGASGMMEMIADETIATDAAGVRAHMERTGHPALSMEDMALYAEAPDGEGKTAVSKAPAAEPERPAPPAAQEKPGKLEITEDALAAIKNEILTSVRDELRASITKEVVGDIIGVLQSRFLGVEPE